MKLAAGLIAILLIGITVSSVSAEPAYSTIDSACYRDAPLVQPRWQPIPEATLVRVEFSYYESFYKTVDTGPLPGANTSTTFVGLPEAASLFYRVAHLPGSGTWQYGEPQLFSTPNCHGNTLPVQAPVSDTEAPTPKVGEAVRVYSVVKPAGSATAWWMTSLRSSDGSWPLVCQNSNASPPLTPPSDLVQGPLNVKAASGLSSSPSKPSGKAWLLWCSSPVVN
jgi:hypothetical protein